MSTFSPTMEVMSTNVDVHTSLIQFLLVFGAIMILVDGVFFAERFYTFMMELDIKKGYNRVSDVEAPGQKEDVEKKENKMMARSVMSNRVQAMFNVIAVLTTLALWGYMIFVFHERWVPCSTYWSSSNNMMRDEGELPLRCSQELLDQFTEVMGGDEKVMHRPKRLFRDWFFFLAYVIFFPLLFVLERIAGLVWYNQPENVSYKRLIGYDHYTYVIYFLTLILSFWILGGMEMTVIASETSASAVYARASYGVGFIGSIFNLISGVFWMCGANDRTETIHPSEEDSQQKQRLSRMVQNIQQRVEQGATKVGLTSEDKNKGNPTVFFFMIVSFLLQEWLIWTMLEPSGLLVMTLFLVLQVYALLSMRMVNVKESKESRRPFHNFLETTFSTRLLFGVVYFTNFLHIEPVFMINTIGQGDQDLETNRHWLGLLIALLYFTTSSLIFCVKSCTLSCCYDAGDDEE